MTKAEAINLAVRHLRRQSIYPHLTNLTVVDGDVQLAMVQDVNDEWLAQAQERLAGQFVVWFNGYAKGWFGRFGGGIDLPIGVRVTKADGSTRVAERTIGTRAKAAPAGTVIAPQPR
ncbi:MAG TPA: hypothetical protein VF796_27575 [Humisphaera sp.]